MLGFQGPSHLKHPASRPVLQGLEQVLLERREDYDNLRIQHALGLPSMIPSNREYPHIWQHHDD